MVNTILPIPPGATIKEQLDIHDMNIKEFAEKMGMSQAKIGKLLSGKIKLSIDIAKRLETVLGIPARFWLKLEVIYRVKQRRLLQWERGQLT